MSHPVRVRGLKLCATRLVIAEDEVAPRAGAWVETVEVFREVRRVLVAPRAGAWVETKKDSMSFHQIPSHPVRVRGLKRFSEAQCPHRGHVAPRAGAWVETFRVPIETTWRPVAPRAGAWVETQPRASGGSCRPSHPVRVRGLKLTLEAGVTWPFSVAPRAGAWVETRGHGMQR